MHQTIRHLFCTAILAGWAGLVGTTLLPTDASAQGYTRLQVLLPGETAAPGTGSGKLGVPKDQVAGYPFDITVRACDNSWNTVTSITNVISITSSDATAGLPGPISLVNGQRTLTVTLNASGSFTFSAKDESDLTIPKATSAAVSSMVLQGFLFKKIKEKDQVAGVPIPIHISAVDPVFNTVTGFTGTARLKQMTTFGEGRISPELVTFTNGVWAGDVVVYRADKNNPVRGNVTIVAYLESDPTIDGTSNYFVVKPNTFTRLQIIVPGETPLPGSVSGLIGTPASQSATQNFYADVYSTDDYWNLVEKGDNVRITSSDPLASTPVSGKLDKGFVRLTVSLGTVGIQTLTVRDLSNSNIKSMTSAGIPVTASTPDHFVIDPIPATVVAGDSVAVRIRATDVNDNTVPDYDGSAILSANTGPGSISPESIVFNRGIWTGKMVFRGAGTFVSFMCADFAAPPHTGTSNSFQVLAGPYTKLQVLLPGQTPKGGTPAGFSGSPTDQNAGTSFNVTIRAVDPYWNRVSGINNRIALSSTDKSAAMPSDTTLINGQLFLPVTLFMSGLQTISVSDMDSTGIKPHTSSQVQINGGTFTRLLILAPGEQIALGTPTGRKGTPIDQSINFAFTVKVYATDNWWNPVDGVSDVVRITSSDPLAQVPPDTALVDGRADLSVRLSTGGWQQITVSNVTQPSMTANTTQVRAISSGFHLEASVSTTSVQAGEPFTLDVKVTNDAGSVIQEIYSLITIEVQNASNGAPGRGTLANSRFQLLQGQRSVQETYTYAEPIVLIVRDDAGNAPAVTEVITVSPGAASAIQLSSTPPWLGGNQRANIRARLVDAFDNGIPNRSMTYSLVSGSGTLTRIDSMTTVNGVARADYLSPRTSEMARIRASSSGVSTEMDLQTALVDPTLPPGTITNYPNPFHPGEKPTTIAYKLADNAAVTIRIYTLNGRLVFRDDIAFGAAGGVVGLNEYTWDGKNSKGDYVASGGYILVLEANGTGGTLHVMRRRIAVVR